MSCLTNSRTYGHLLRCLFYSLIHLPPKCWNASRILTLSVLSRAFLFTWPCQSINLSLFTFIHTVSYDATWKLNIEQSMCKHVHLILIFQLFSTFSSKNTVLCRFFLTPHLHINIFFLPLHKLAKTLASAEILNIWGTLQISTKSPHQHSRACRRVYVCVKERGLERGREGEKRGWVNVCERRGGGRRKNENGDRFWVESKAWLGLMNRNLMVENGFPSVMALKPGSACN